MIDGAFDVRALSAALGLEEKAGLSELLDAPDQDGATLLSLVQPTLHERIAVLPHGNDTGDRAIRAEALRLLLAAACAHYDFVLVQGSLLIKGSQSMAFSSLVDAALLIAVEERTTMDQIARGQRLLNDCGARRVALVLANRPHVRPPRVR
jgi:Mrp family chromosome partitioning ATPase